ncbi:MAG: hypothetical protein AAF403_06905 [Pseudomonadota bacterium]
MIKKSTSPEQDELEIADELIAERRAAPPGKTPDDMHPILRMIIGPIDRLNHW